MAAPAGTPPLPGSNRRVARVFGAVAVHINSCARSVRQAMAKTSLMTPRPLLALAAPGNDRVAGIAPTVSREGFEVTRAR